MLLLPPARVLLLLLLLLPVHLALAQALVQGLGRRSRWPLCTMRSNGRVSAKPVWSSLRTWTVWRLGPGYSRTGRFAKRSDWRASTSAAMTTMAMSIALERQQHLVRVPVRVPVPVPVLAQGRQPSPAPPSGSPRVGGCKDWAPSTRLTKASADDRELVT